jgi:flagellar basal-body rod modification protein FlgD
MASRVSGSDAEMSIAATTATGSANTSSSTSSSSAAATAYNTFLSLLTTQLENQDPLNATDPNQFTSELISITQLEGQQTTNDDLSTIVSSLSSFSTANGVGYIGKTIVATSSSSPLQNGTANWSYDLASTASAVTLTVTDVNGNTVYTTSGDTSTGDHAFQWTGTETDGTTAASGAYTLTVTATSSSGAAITSTISSLGTVTGVDTSDGTTELDMGGVLVPLDDVTGIA